MKRLLPASLIALLPLVMGGCLLPQPDTPPIPSMGRLPVGGPGLVPQPDTPPIPASAAGAMSGTAGAAPNLANPTVAADTGFDGRNGLPENGATIAIGAPAGPPQGLADLGPLQPFLPLPKGFPLALGSEVSADHMASLWPEWKTGQAWRYRQEPEGVVWRLKVEDARVPSFSWGSELDPPASGVPLAALGLPTDAQGAANQAMQMAGVENLDFGAGQMAGPCVVLERVAIRDGLPERLRVWIAPQRGILRLVEGPLEGGADRSWLYLGEETPEGMASATADPGATRSP